MRRRGIALEAVQSAGTSAVSLAPALSACSLLDVLSGLAGSLRGLCWLLSVRLCSLLSGGWHCKVFSWALRST